MQDTLTLTPEPEPEPEPQVLAISLTYENMGEGGWDGAVLAI